MNRFSKTQRLFVRVLEIAPKLAAFLVTNGFETLEEVAFVPTDEFRSIDGLSEQQIQAWRIRARSYLLSQAIGGGDDEDPLTVDTVDPPKPMSGGSDAKLNED